MAKAAKAIKCGENNGGVSPGHADNRSEIEKKEAK